MPFKVKSGIGVHEDPNQTPTWDDIGRQISPVWFDDMHAAAVKLLPDAPVRRLLKYLLLSKIPSSMEVCAMFDKGSWTTFPPQVAGMKVAAVIDEYIVAHRELFRKDWPRRAQKSIAALFIALGELPSKRYPIFDHGLLPVRAGAISKSPKSLGLLEWPELIGIRPGHRDEEAIELVQSNIISILEESENIFAFGQAVMSATSPPPCVNDECWWRVKEYLEELVTRLNGGDPLRKGVVEGVNRSSTWIYAGFPKAYATEAFFEPYAVRELASRCIGATNRLTASVKLYLCTITGWNRTQLGLVPRDPYAFRYDDEFGICQAAFMAVFKRRAGHFVNAHLERGNKVSQISREQNSAFWDDTARELGDDIQARIVNRPSAMDVLDRYVKLTDPLRKFDIEKKFTDRFFISIGQHGLSDTDLNLREYKLSELLNRDGVSYRTARQSFVNTVRRSTGSLLTSIHLTNNTSTGVVLTHYDDLEIQAELDAAIAFWQNCFQALIVDGDASLRCHLVISEDDLVWFRNLAVPSGIASSLQVRGRKLTVHERGYLVLEWSSETFQEVYLIKLGVLAARERVGEQRWRLQGVPILGHLVAMRRHLLNAGLIEQYFNAARTAMRRLQKNEIVIPTVMDD